MQGKPRVPRFTFNEMDLIHEAKLARYSALSCMVLGYLAGVRSWWDDFSFYKDNEEFKVGTYTCHDD